MKVKHGCNINSGELDTSRYSAPMPAIGLYIAGASLTCLVLATIDTITGCKAFGKKPRQKFWFPCKWFGINSATLTLLSVATKLPVDLNTAMPGPHHQLTKLSGTVMLSVATAFFLPAFGTMKIEDKLSNLAALIILIITVAVNICIQMGTGVIFAFLPEHIIVLGFMLFMLVSVFTATISSEGVKDELEKSSDKVLGKLNSVLESLKEKKANSVSDIEEGARLGKEGLKRCLYMKHTAYAKEIGHATIRSPNGSAVAVLSILSTLVLVEAEVRALIMWLMARGRRGSGGMQLFGLQFCRGESDYRWPMWLILASQTLFVILTTIPLLFRWFESVRFVRHPIKEMLKWPHLLAVELKRLSLSRRKILEFFLEEKEAGGGGDGRQRPPHTYIGRLLHSTKMFFVSLQLLGSVMSWIISRSSSAPLCLLFWSLKRPGDSQEGKMRDHMVVHLEDEEDFGNWMYTHYESDVDKEMGKTNDPSTTSPPHGNDSDGKHLKKILSKFDSTTDQIIENENDHFRSILEMIDNFQRPKCMEIVLGMVIIANKLAQVEVDRNKGYNCLWNVKPNQNLNGSPPQDVKIVEQFLRNIDQYVPGGPSAFSGNYRCSTHKMIASLGKKSSCFCWKP
ncbi:uncharacterized protein LOC116253734 isoform X2 [Nymphaea colorata]|uniref:uncharacterized protein LOC116253734 isoform X2 n=1 Tax=Nymphaea colorata TaxID=210225 RepID=UPI00129D9B53|nr:uncharacterized protein LOC116253734 isoform X2 [Nymphaea colorata]